jgi:hypothetical protein
MQMHDIESKGFAVVFNMQEKGSTNKGICYFLMF